MSISFIVATASFELKSLGAPSRAYSLKKIEMAMVVFSYSS